MSCIIGGGIEWTANPGESAFTGIEAEAQGDSTETACGGGEEGGWDQSRE